jgi:hypothetical protein
MIMALATTTTMTTIMATTMFTSPPAPEFHRPTQRDPIP